MALRALQLNANHYDGKNKKWRVFYKKQSHRKLRRMPIGEDECGRKTKRLPTLGWLY